MNKLEKISLACAGTGTAVSIGLTAFTVNRLMGMPEDTMVQGKEVASLMIKCYSPMYIGMIPMASMSVKEAYKDIKERFFYKA